MADSFFVTKKRKSAPKANPELAAKSNKYLKKRDKPPSDEELDSHSSGSEASSRTEDEGVDSDEEVKLEEEKETAAAKRLRLAKQLIESVKQDLPSGIQSIVH